jgi:phosphoribosylformimino-5-aminoimidazole carboxamide ribotide isomerase
MIAIPAIDIRDAACVQLVGGSYDAERIRIADPIAVAAQWRSVGFTRLHVVDLDAATGRGTNDDVVAQLLHDGTGVQVGGGVRSEQRIAELLDAGAERVVTGTRALEDHPWLADVCAAAPGRVIVAMDVRQGQPVVRGWSQPVPRELRDLLDDLTGLPLAGILVTSVDVEGQLRGPDVSLISDVLDATALPVIAAGGITTVEDLRTLDALGVAAAVIGMALYTGDMDAARCAEEFG